MRNYRNTRESREPEEPNLVPSPHRAGGTRDYKRNQQEPGNCMMLEAPYSAIIVHTYFVFLLICTNLHL